MFFKPGLAAAVLAALIFSSCSPKAGETVVLEVGPTKVTMQEFENFYRKNSLQADSTANTPAERERFLDLLTRYKLKLQDAADRNLGDDPEVKKELKDYRASLATTYLIEKEISEPGVRLLYDRKTEEIRAKHILVAVKPEASPADTLKAYEKAVGIIAKLRAGADFDSLAVADSEDPTAKVNHGDLYFFTGGQMVIPFENAAYAMKSGGISAVPIRTSFGYHVIKITQRQPVRGTIKVRHIMALAKQSAADTGDTVAALARIRGWQDSLKTGIDFAEFAKRVSEDAGSAVNGGSLGWFERKRYVQPFDEAAFLLKPGEMSPIIRTPYGYHILRCDSIRPMETYEQMRAQQGDPLKKQYQQVRFSDDYNAFIAGLKKEFAYSFSEGSFSSLLSVLDSNTTTQDSGWDANLTTAIRRAPLMQVGGVAYTVDTVLTMLLERPELQNTLLRRSELEQQFRRISEGLLLEAKSVGLESRSPDFASLMADYRDGIILYKAEQLEVWDRISVTDSALHSYYDAHASDFMFPAEVTFAEMNFAQDTTAFMVFDSLMKGADFATLAAVYNFDDSLKAKGGVNKPQPEDLDDVTRLAGSLQVGGISEPIDLGSGSFLIVKLISKTAPRQKSFDEAGAELSNAYQDYEAKRMENAWLERIRKKHAVVQHREVLSESVPGGAEGPPAGAR
jgi:peptidyl-prolyl cis-trans isomerase SurA